MSGDSDLLSSLVGMASVSSYDIDAVRDAVVRALYYSSGSSHALDEFKTNPFEAYLPQGGRVVIKPNWVLHENHGAGGFECLVTQAPVVEAIAGLLVPLKPSSVIIGDAPVQGCDFANLSGKLKLQEMLGRLSALGLPVQLKDFRRTVLENAKGVWNRADDVRSLDEYIEVDLGKESLLEPISAAADKFRVTMYDPDKMRRTHAPGMHKYLVSRDILTADLVINVPKLKTHKKAGITGALKNVVGINGNKEYLPHHRMGGAAQGGDCYPGANILKKTAERLLDGANRRSGRVSYSLRLGSRVFAKAATLLGSDNNLEGSWHGNDTVWRMCLDLDRVLLYGNTSGRLGATQARRVVTITDAIACGEGEGPLSPTPKKRGLITAGANLVACEYAHAHIMGFDWKRIPIIKNAFSTFSHPLCQFSPESVTVVYDNARSAQPWSRWFKDVFVPPSGWRGNCEVPTGAAL